MTLATLAVIGGIALLLWSASVFVDGAAAAARYYRVPPLVIGMVVIGFGTSAPELMVSGLAAMQGKPGIALGNAYGSNITNIALILGLSALISPIAVNSGVLRKELPILTAITALAAWQLSDGAITRLDALVLLTIFAALMAWTIRQGRYGEGDALSTEMAQALQAREQPIGRSIAKLLGGLVILIASSRLLVWGAVAIAQAFQVSDLIIGLTVVAVGTSLPELASSIAAVRRNEHDLALGNVVGSNLFNTLAVVGIAAALTPLAAEPATFYRDVPVMGALTVSLFIIGYGFGGRPGRINRFEAAALLAAYLAYTLLLASSALGG